jgi:hypothetical protein
MRRLFVAARRRRPVLYEVVRRDRGGLPEWKLRPEHPSPEAFPPTASPSIVSAPAEQSEPAEPAPMVQVVDERVNLSLSWPVIAVVLAGFLVALAVSFHAGTRYAQQTGTPGEDALTPTETGSRLSEGTEVADRGAGRLGERPGIAPTRRGSAEAGGNASASAPERPSPPPARQPTLAELPKGYHYIFIQFFRKSRMKDAQDAAEFLRANGLPCVIQESREDIRLIATQPLLLDQRDVAARQRERQRCDELKRRIKELGKEYARAGGGYAFDQCFERKVVE